METRTAFGKTWGCVWREHQRLPDGKVSKERVVSAYLRMYDARLPPLDSLKHEGSDGADVWMVEGGGLPLGPVMVCQQGHEHSLWEPETAEA